MLWLEFGTDRWLQKLISKTASGRIYWVFEILSAKRSVLPFCDGRTWWLNWQSKKGCSQMSQWCGLQGGWEDVALLKSWSVGSGWKLQRGRSQLGLSPLFFHENKQDLRQCIETYSIDVTFTTARQSPAKEEGKWENNGFTIIPSFSKGQVNRNYWWGR